jgi:glycosyltransferase involved in cell wall biosynthesis
MVKAVEASNAGAQLVLAGPVESGALLRRVESSPAAEYLGQLPASEIPRVLSESRLGLAVLHPHSNYLEAQPTKVFEYMAAGRPFIASNFPAWQKLFGGFDCGIFVDPLDVGAITAAIDYLLNDVEASRQMGERGRTALLECFGFEAEAVRLTDMTRWLLQ